MERSMALRVVEVIERHAREGLTEIRAILETGSEVALADIAREPEDDVRKSEIGAPGPDTEAVDAAIWHEIDRRAGETQRWPDGNIDSYGEFVVYRGSGKFAHLTLALGYASTLGKEGEVVGFVTNAAGGAKRPLTVFFPADDYADSRERLSLIRGKGGSGGRKTFAPNDALPDAYRGIKTTSLAGRIRGKWNVASVVAGEGEDGVRVMLSHTAIQTVLRGIS